MRTVFMRALGSTGVGLVLCLLLDAPAMALKGPPATRVGDIGSECAHHEASDLGSGYIMSAGKCLDTFDVWLVQHRPSGGGGPSTVIVDHKTFRALAPSEKFSIGPYCYRNGKAVMWAAIYDWNKKNTIPKGSGGIKEAWVPNLTAGRFEPASKDLIDAVECFASESE